MVNFSKTLAYLGGAEPGNTQVQKKQAQTLLGDLDSKIHLRKEALLVNC